MIGLETPACGHEWGVKKFSVQAVVEWSHRLA
jgi:hypothetical protein